MKNLYKLFLVLASASFFYASAQAQNAGNVTDHAFALGRGTQFQGFKSLVCGTTQLPIGQTSADPICAALSGDVTMSASGITAIGAGKVTNAQHATMAANTTKCNATAGVATPTDCTGSTMRTNLGLVIGTNVQAWDTDLDCLAALSSTGVISRTGSGTCSAGALALSGLATGTQDTVIGYFGSTTASATALSNCTGALTYSTATHTFGCNAAAGTGTVTSVGVTNTYGFTVTGSPVTTTGNINVEPNFTTYTQAATSNTTISNVSQTTLVQVTQGSTGTFQCIATLTWQSSNASPNVAAILTDGTTSQAGTNQQGVTSTNQSLTLSGFFASPAGNIRLNAQANATGATARFNDSGTSKDTKIDCWRMK